MRFGMLGTGFWAREVHAAGLAAHPDAELVGVWGRNLAKAKAAGAQFDVEGYDDLDALLAECDAVSVALPPDVQVEVAARAAAAGKHLLLEKPIALNVAGADQLVTAVRDGGVASVVFFTFRFQAETASWLAQAARTTLAGGHAEWLASLAGSPFDSSPWRKEQGALWDVGPHALSVLIPSLGPVVAVQAGAGVRDTVHLVFKHASGAASTATLSLTVAPMSAGTEFFVHGDAGRIVLIPEERAAPKAYAVAVDELMAAAVAGGTHPCGVEFGWEVVLVLEAAQRALASGCSEPIGT
jgi:predicted dehydrogenase